MYDELIRVHKELDEYFANYGRREKHGQGRENGYKSNLWDSQSSHETNLRANEKREERRGKVLEQVSQHSLSRCPGRG